MILLESNGNIIELRKATEIHALCYFLKDSVYIAKAMATVTAEQFETYGEIYNLFVTIYTVIITSLLFSLGGFINAVYAKYFVSKPARSCVAVKDIPKGALCEIEAIASIE